jgi:hypothetical protein
MKSRVQSKIQKKVNKLVNQKDFSATLKARSLRNNRHFCKHHSSSQAGLISDQSASGADASEPFIPVDIQINSQGENEFNQFDIDFEHGDNDDDGQTSNASDYGEENINEDNESEDDDADSSSNPFDFFCKESDTTMHDFFMAIYAIKTKHRLSDLATKDIIKMCSLLVPNQPKVC